MIHCLFGDEQWHNALCSEILGKDECGISATRGRRNTLARGYTYLRNYVGVRFLEKTVASIITLHA